MAVSGVDPNGLAPQRRAPDSSSLKMDDFMKLLATQLQNQDMNNPMSNSEMMGQLTSMATVQSMNTFSELSSTQYAINLMGKEVTVAEVNEVTHKMETKEGVVVGINLSDMTFFLKDNPKGYGLGNVMQVGTIPKAPEDDKEEDDDKDPSVDDPKPEHPVEKPDPEEPETKPEDQGGPGESKSNPAAASLRGRAAAGSTQNPAGPGNGIPNTAASDSITTLPDGRASVPVGAAAQDGRSAAQSSRTAGPGGSTADSAESDSKKEAWSLASAKAAALSEQAAADKAAALTEQAARSRQTDKAVTLAEQTYKNIPVDKVKVLAEQAAGGIPTDKAAALAEQAARTTIPADKAAALERYRQTRGATANIGPGYFT